MSTFSCGDAYDTVVRRCPECGASYEDEVSFCGLDGKITVEVQPPDDHDPRLGNKLGEYIVAARIADGGMGRVYEGRHPDTKQRVAIKVLHANIAEDAVAVERFKREYETAEEFEHTNMVKVHEFGATPDGSHFMTMEYLDGSELSGALAEGAFSPARILHVMSQLADGLDYAHSFGVVHRDMKPDNVFLCQSESGDVVKLLDFGSVKLQMETGPKLTAFGTTLGSPYYMSPEQAMGKLDVDQRTDVFAAAAIAWELGTGTIAFDGKNVAEILTKIVGVDPPPPSTLNDKLTERFDAAVLGGVKKDKTERPGSAGALADSIFKAFGLLDRSEWLGKPVAELKAAIEGTTPPPPSIAPPPKPAPQPAATGRAPMSQAQNAASAAALRETMPMDAPDSPLSEIPVASSNMLLWVGLGVAAVVVLLVVAILFV